MYQQEGAQISNKAKQMYGGLFIPHEFTSSQPAV